MKCMTSTGVHSRLVLIPALLLAVLSLAVEAQESGGTLRLSKSVIYLPGAPAILGKAEDMLVDEIEKRSGIRLPRVDALPDDGSPAILIGTADTLSNPALKPPEGLSIPDKAEGYAIWVDRAKEKTPIVCLAGHDAPGALFAVGRFLRMLHYGEGSLTIEENTRVASAPRFAIRGHQIGYRNTPNAYDAWDLATYEQYIRDLALFGNNCIEFTPTLDPTEEESPHMTRTTWDMTNALSTLLDEYNLNCWIWLEILGEVDVSVPEVAEEQLALRRKLFESMEGLDTVFVPGGDGGLTPAPILMPFLERMKKVLDESRPGAALWVSNQTFEVEENDYFFNFLQEQKPDWLTGVVYGPWTKLGVPEMRKRTPAAYPVRLYADITHNVRCQYPVPNWDRVFAHGLNREAPNPRPVDMHIIFTKYAPLVGDSITYSEGVNDDLNKFIWTALGWDPETPLHDILFDYGKMFFGEDQAEAVVQGLLMLEENWRGPIAANQGLEKTLQHWVEIEKRCKGGAAANWRLQMYLLRAHYDVYLQQKAEAESLFESQAYDALRQASAAGVEKAIQEARAALAQIDSGAPGADHRRRIEQLAADLFKSIGMQLSVKPPYRASGPERCALLDTLDFPLNDRPWLEKQFEEILAMTDNAQRLARVEAIVNWENPGAGGYYDDLGNPTKQPHLVQPAQYEDDPGFVNSTQCEYSFGIDKETVKPTGERLSWLDQAQTLYGRPIQMHYEGLDPKADYRLRVTYAGRFRSAMRLVADGRIPVHDWLAQPKPCWPVEFDVPHDATADGVLDLEWQLNLEKDKSLHHRPMGRGCQIAEVWLIKK